MQTISWRFPPLSGGTRQGYTNNDIEAFKGEELMDNLAREVCQNSLDAKILTSKDPVRVVFELKEVPSSDYAVFSDYTACIAGCRRYWGESMDSKLARFLDDAEEMLSRPSIPVLVASDYNTKGLRGSRSRELDSPWEALTGADGVSVKNNETSGGSYGIGKNAPFACSALSMVFYNTCAEDQEKAFIGVARMATLLNQENKETQRVGRYQKNDDANERWTPIFAEDADPFRDLFQRTEQGSDVIVVGFNQVGDWMNRIAKAIIKNFFVAISERKLIVELRGGQVVRRIDSSTLGLEIAGFDHDHDKEMVITSQLYKAFTEPDRKESLSIVEENDAEVYIKADSSFGRTIAHFRDTGMLIYLKSRRIFQHYAAVFVVRGEKLGALLRATEPARHNRWDYKLITGSSQEEKDKRKAARISIQKIDDDVLALLRSQFEVATADTVDAAGVGEYLPDDVDGLAGAAVGDDILKAKIKIGKVKTVESRTGTITVPAKKDEGAAQTGQVHNHEKNPNPQPPRPQPPRPVHPDVPVDDPKQGASKGKGTKTIVVPNLSAQRAFPINSSMGLYKIVIKPTEAYSNLYVSCSALGEDGKTDLLEMETFTYSGSPVPIRDGKAGPIKVDANVPATFFVKFSSKEKMVLNLNIMEVPKR